MNNIKRGNNILFEGCVVHGLFFSCNYQVINPCNNILLSKDKNDTFSELTNSNDIELFPELSGDKIILLPELNIDDESDNIDTFSELTIDNKIQDRLQSNNKIIFDKCENILNIEFIKDTGYIKILKPGIYIINLSCQFNEEGEIIICVNNIPDMLSLTKTITPYNFITIHYVLNLKCNDILSFHNYSSHALTTYVIDDGYIDNVCLHLCMISSQKL